VALAIEYGVSSAAHGRELAQEAATTQQVSDFLVELFRSADPVEGFGDTVRARVILDEGALRLADTDVRPDIRARMMTALALVYYNLGLYDDAASLHRSALALQREVHGPEHPEVAETLTHLADAYFGNRAFEDAEPLYREALLLYRRLGTDPLSTATALQGLARVQRELGQADSAKAMLNEVLALRRAALGDDHFQTLWAELDVAYALRGGGDPDSARTVYQSVIPKLRMHGDSGARLLPSALNNLAYLHMTQGDLADAESLYREAVTLERQWGTAPEVILLLNNLAGVLDRQGDTAGTEEVLREAIGEAEGHWPEGGLQIGLNVGALGAWYLGRGDTGSAEPLLRRALDEFMAAFGDSHSRTTHGKVQLAGCLVAMGRYAEAEPYLVQAFQWLRANRGMENTYTQEVGSQLAELYDAWNRPAQAAEYRRLLERVQGSG
jgi:serine/threonine-protein kinase